MEFYVLTPSGVYLVMETWGGNVKEVWPAPPDSLPAAAPAQPASGK